MSRVRCEWCGQSLEVNQIDAGRVYLCCAGCALRARVPVDAEGNYPINADLICALVVVFLFFNQLLDWGLDVLLAGQGRSLLADRFAVGGVVLACLVWVGLVSLAWRAGSLRGKDWVVTLVSLALLATAFPTARPQLGRLIVANSLILIWNFRGLFRRRLGSTP